MGFIYGGYERRINPKALPFPQTMGDENMRWRGRGSQKAMIRLLPPELKKKKVVVGGEETDDGTQHIKRGGGLSIVTSPAADLMAIDFPNAKYPAFFLCRSLSFYTY